MKLMTEWCCAANDSMFLLPSSSVSPKAYSAALVENRMRASANVIHPRSSGGNAVNERASAASVVPSSFAASGGAAAFAPESLLIRLISPLHDHAHALQIRQQAFSGKERPVSITRGPRTWLGI